VYGGNRPLIGVDPNGALFGIDDALLIAMAIGAAFNTATNAGNIHDAGDFFKYAGIGALGGAMGYAPGALINYVPVGFIQGFGYGAAVGGLTGGVTNSLNGGSFGSGFLGGAIGGGIFGGISGYRLANRIGQNPWTGARLPSEPLDIPSLATLDTSLPTNTSRMQIEPQFADLTTAREEAILERIQNIEGLGNGPATVSNGYGQGNTRWPNPRNDCSLRVARTLGISDQLNTGNAATYLRNPVAYNSERLQVAVWQGRGGNHMGFVRNALLYHMTPQGLQMGSPLSTTLNYLRRSTVRYYNPF
jgi:hypothetical protein